jgi:PAS domain S-box-containing protein
MLFERASVGILVINENGSIELANSCAENLFRYSQEELIGQPIENLISVNLHLNPISHRSYSTQQNGKPTGLGIEMSACKKGGVIFPIEISLAHHGLNGGNMAVAFIIDITERKKSEIVVHESKRRLEDEVQALKDLNESGSHLWQIENLNQGLREILETSIRLTRADKGNVQLWDAEKLMLRIAVQKGFDDEFLEHFKEVRAEDSSACARALFERKQVVVSDTIIEWFGSNEAIARKNGFRAVQSTPLFASNGTPIGMISTHFRNPGIPDEFLRRIELYARCAQSFIERIKNYETIQKQNLELKEKIKNM